MALSAVCDKATNYFDIVVIIMIIVLPLVKLSVLLSIDIAVCIFMASPPSFVVWEYLSLTQRTKPQPGCCIQTVFILLTRIYPELL